MPIEGIKQPEVIPVDDVIRLRKFYAAFDFALPWYEDEDTIYLVDGVRRSYDLAHLELMYRWLDSSGELYFIEYKFGDNFTPVGDVTFSDKNIPIVIGEKSCRGKQIGRKVISALIERARSLGYKSLHVDEIFDYNIASRKCFESVGFKATGKTEKGMSYTLIL